MPTSSRDLLLIEDSEADRVLISAMLSEQAVASWQVETRSTLADGLELLRRPESASRFAAVLVDLALPDSHGLETFAAVYDVAKSLPMIVLTGNDDAQAALAAVQAGAQDYLFKNSLTGDLLQKSLCYAIERNWLEHEWRDVLELRVRERTAELSVANEILQREIAERRRAEEALQDSQRFVERITNATPSVVYILDVVTRRVVYVNEQLQTMLGFSPDDLRMCVVDDGHLVRAVHPEDLDRVKHAFDNAGSLDDDAVQEVEARARHADGTWRWLLDRTVVFRRAPSGAVRLVLGAINDITDRKRTEEKSRQQQEQLVYASRLTMLGELASGLAHELNQPLMAVANYSQACLRKMRSGEFAHEELTSWLEKCTKQALLAGEIVKRLRRLVSKRPPEQSETDINETIREVYDAVRPEAEGRAVHLRLELDEILPRVPADRIQLQQVMLNLIRNGFDALRDQPTGDRWLTVESAQLDDEQVAISVTDHGEGCDAQSIERLFEPFYTTKEHGLGMGLAISRSIIEAHGGRLTAQPNPNRGLRFQFTLPIQSGNRG